LMRRFRRYLPLLAGPVLLLLFAVTGELIGPGEGGDGLYEKVRHLRKRSSTLEKAGELLSDVNDYLGIGEEAGAIPSPVDPKGEWMSILEPLGDGAFSWSEIPTPERDRYELRVSASFREIHELFARIDARGAGTQIEEMVMRGEGTNVAVTLLLAVSTGKGGAS
jgi:hypothetical protein